MRRCPDPLRVRRQRLAATGPRKLGWRAHGMDTPRLLQQRTRQRCRADRASIIDSPGRFLPRFICVSRAANKSPPDVLSEGRRKAVRLMVLKALKAPEEI